MSAGLEYQADSDGRVTLSWQSSRWPSWKPRVVYLDVDARRAQLCLDISRWPGFWFRSRARITFEDIAGVQLEVTGARAETRIVVGRQSGAAVVGWLRVAELDRCAEAEDLFFRLVTPIAGGRGSYRSEASRWKGYEDEQRDDTRVLRLRDENTPRLQPLRFPEGRADYSEPASSAAPKIESGLLDGWLVKGPLAALAVVGLPGNVVTWSYAGFSSASGGLGVAGMIGGIFLMGLCVGSADEGEGGPTTSMMRFCAGAAAWAAAGLLLGLDAPSATLVWGLTLPLVALLALSAALGAFDGLNPEHWRSYFRDAGALALLAVATLVNPW